MPKNLKEYSMHEFETLIGSIKKRSGLTEEQICEAINYNEGYISQTRSRGKVSGKFIQALKGRFPETLQNANLSPEPVTAYKGIDDLAHSNRILADSNAKMVDAILNKLSLLDVLKSNWDNLPGSMNLLTKMILDDQKKNLQVVTQKIDRLRGIPSPDTKDKKLKQTEKHSEKS